VYPFHHISKMFQHMHADQAGGYINALPLLLPLPKSRTTPGVAVNCGTALWLLLWL
jgi:hypothetical protein